MEPDEFSHLRNTTPMVHGLLKQNLRLNCYENFRSHWSFWIVWNKFFFGLRFTSFVKQKKYYFRFREMFTFDFNLLFLRGTNCHQQPKFLLGTSITATLVTNYLERSNSYNEISMWHNNRNMSWNLRHIWYGMWMKCWRRTWLWKMPRNVPSQVG